GHLMECCRRLLRPGETFYDIGANTGIFGLDLLMSVKGLNVVMFEPQRNHAKHIRASIVANGFDKAQLFEMALGDENKVSSFFLTSHSIHASIVPREDRFQEISVEMRTLDSLLYEKAIPPPDVIKIDVEGSELATFRGARDSLSRYAPSL